jgi:hypothetical protein
MRPPRDYGWNSTTKRNSTPDEIGMKHVTCNVAPIGADMKTFVCLSLAFVLSAAVAVIQMTSSPERAGADNTASYLY